MWRSEITCRSQFSFSTMWDLGIELRLLGLAASSPLVSPFMICYIFLFPHHKCIFIKFQNICSIIYIWTRTWDFNMGSIFLEIIYFWFFHLFINNLYLVYLFIFFGVQNEMVGVDFFKVHNLCYVVIKIILKNSETLNTPFVLHWQLFHCYTLTNLRRHRTQEQLILTSQEATESEKGRWSMVSWRMMQSIRVQYQGYQAPV